MIFLIVYFRFRHACLCGRLPTKTSFSNGTCRAVDTLAQSERGVLAKIKTTRLGGLNFWQGHLCNSRTDFLYELLLFGKDIKVFIKHINKK